MNVAMQNFWIGAAMGFVLGAVVTAMIVAKYREWDEKRFEQKWHVRRYGRRI